MMTEELHCNERFKRSLKHARNRDAQVIHPNDTTKRKLVGEEVQEDRLNNAIQIQSLSGRSIVRVAPGLRWYYRPDHDQYPAAMLRAKLPRDEWPDYLFDGTTQKRPKATLARHDQDSPESGLVQQQGKRHIEFANSRGDPFGSRDSHDRGLAYHSSAYPWPITAHTCRVRKHRRRLLRPPSQEASPRNMRRLLPSPRTANSVDSGASLSSILNDGDRQKVPGWLLFLVSGRQ
ncbi:hypothetical protein HDK64DRAFT_267261 [Phyllosticta capitalensis]